MTRKPEPSALRGNWWSMLLGVACLVYLAGPLPVSASPDPHADGQGRASVTRGGGSSSGGSAGRSSVSQGSGGGGASATRPGGSGGGSGRTQVHRPPRSSRPPSSGHRGGYHGYYDYHRYGYYPFFGFNFFRYPFYLGYYGYPYGYGRYGRYGPVWYDYQASASLGGLDLNIKPKKAEVFVDGQRIGRVGRFDGYPGLLWLEEGTYDLVVYYPGYRTLHQTVKVFAGVVIDIDDRMVAGESIPPEDFVPPPSQTPPPDQSARSETLSEDPQRGDVDLSHEPARLHLTIEPRDASVYLDGRFLGTGDELADLRSGLMVNPGEHRLAVVRPSFDSEELTVDVAAGEDVELAVQLQQGGGR